MNLKQELKSVIDRLMADLNNYAQRPEASEKFIEKQNKLIAELVSIYNNINCLDYQRVWEKADKTLLQMLERDPFLGGFFLEVRLREVGHFGALHINAEGNGI